MSRRGPAVALLLVALSAGGEAQAAHICWIDRVERAAGGLNLYFVERAELRVNVSGRLDQVGFYFVSGGVAHQRRGRELGGQRAGVLAGVTFETTLSCDRRR